MSKNKTDWSNIIKQAASVLKNAPWHLSYTNVRQFLRDSESNLLSDFESLGSKRFNSLRDKSFLPNTSPLDVEDEILKRAAKHARAKQEDSLEYQVFLQRFEEISDKLFKDKIIVKPYVGNNKNKYARELNLVLSDLHFQSLLTSKKGTLDFGSVEEARRLAAVIKQVCEYKVQHRAETTLNIHIIGDIIAGGIHWPREGAGLEHQSCAAMHLLGQAVAYCSAHFPKVVVKVAPGNHGRWPHQKDRGAVNKTDCLETVIYSGVKNSVKHIKNVDFIIPETPYYIHHGIGGDLFFTHGDTIFPKGGNIGNSINLKELEVQANKIKTSLKRDIKIFCCGHFHTPVTAYTSSGTIIMVNGALIPSDQYANSIGIFSNTCGQWLFESTPDHALGDSRLIAVGETDDKDFTLDNIVKPYTGF